MFAHRALAIRSPVKELPRFLDLTLRDGRGAAPRTTGR
jgi:hypothetical protein